MVSLDAVRHRLDLQFDKTLKRVDELALNNMHGATLSDLYAFNKAIKQNSIASFTVNREFAVKHNLAKAIIDEIR